MQRRSLEDIKAAHPGACTFRFGDNPEIMARILELVRSGAKTATCDALEVFTKGGEAMPVVGRRDIALNMDGTPALLIETLDVSIRRFNEIDEAFVAAHGEFDRLEDWRQAYRQELCARGEFSEDMELMCEKFRLVEDFPDV